MKPIKGYDTAPAYDGTAESIPAGGHICRIIGAKVEENQYVDGNPEQIVLALEIAEGSKLDGICKRRYDAACKRNPGSKPMWGCTWSTFLLNRDGECSGFFKGMISAVEKSNDGFKWSWDEMALKGKLIGVVFREEEFIARNDGSIKTTTKPYQIRSVETIREGVEIPEIKRVDTRNSASPLSRAQSMFGDKLQEVDDDELPF